MSKKKKSPPNLSTQEIEYQANQQLIGGFYKEAIDSYKQLLKQEEREEWRVALSTAYLERAKSLASKEMYKEAAILWENRATLCREQSALDLYLLWLIQGGRYIRAARLYQESFPQLAESEIHQQLLAWFALLMLTNHDEVKEFFPIETSFHQQYQVIHSALQAYCQGDDSLAEMSLKQVSFRSPYRDFRSILKALMLFERSDESGVRQILTPIASSSPFFRFSQLILSSINFDENSWDLLTQLGPHELTLLTYLKGWDKAQLKIILMLHTAIKKANSKTIFGTILTHYRSLGEHDSRKFCLALLPDYLAGLKDYQKTFGKLSLFEQEQISALAEERRQQFGQAERHWRKCVDILKQHQNEGDNSLKIALILRHLVDIAKREFKDTQRNRNLMLQDLAESLILDPSDKPTYLELITAYKELDDDKNYQMWVEAAVEQFPRDTEILMIAIGAARHRKAFRKATRLANALLQVDPINIKARQVLLSSHLAHTHKLIKNGKFDLARKELEQANGLERENQRSGILPIIRGLLEWQDHQKETAISFLSEGIEQAGGNLKGYLYLLVEASRLSIEVRPLLKELPFFKKQKFGLFSSKPKFPVPQCQDVLSLIVVLNRYQEEKVAILPNILESLEPSLEQVNYQEFSQDELIKICQCFDKIKVYSLLERYASEALKRWIEVPIFVYYHVYAKATGKINAVSDSDFERLEKALEQSHRTGDKRAAMLLADFLTKSFRNNVDNLFDELTDLDDEEDDIDEEQIKKLLERLRKAGLDVPELPEFTNPKRKLQGKK